MPITPDLYKGIGKEAVNVVKLDDIRKPDLIDRADASSSETLRAGFEAALALDDSPLREVTPDSIDVLFSRVNDKLALGLPVELSEDDELVEQIVNVYRVQALNWALEESQEKERKRRTSKAVVAAIDIDL